MHPEPEPSVGSRRQFSSLRTLQQPQNPNLRKAHTPRASFLLAWCPHHCRTLGVGALAMRLMAPTTFGPATCSWGTIECERHVAVAV